MKCSLAVEVSMCSGDVQSFVDARFVTGWSTLLRVLVLLVK